MDLSVFYKNLVFGKAFTGSSSSICPFACCQQRNGFDNFFLFLLHKTQHDQYRKRE